MPGCGCKKQQAPAKEELSQEQEAVRMKEESQKLIGLEVIAVQKAPLQSAIELVGEIATETENVMHITSSEAGTLQKYIAQLGDTVEKGNPLCVIQRKAGEPLEISSPNHGIVLAQYLKSGDSVDILTSIMTIANPDLLRASFSVYEKDLAGIKIGQEVHVKSIAYPGKDFSGKISFISPAVDEKTRTIKIRVDVSNEEHLLKFGMFVTGEIVVPVSEPVLVLPEIAIQNIKGKTVIFVPDTQNKEKFLIKEVQTGRKGTEQIEIVQGISEETQVVGKGSFHLKAELLKGELEEE